MNLIPRGNRQVDTFREALHEFGSIDYLIVLLEAGKDEGPDEIEDFADLFAEKLRARDGLVESVEYRFQPDARFMQLFSENALLFLPPEQLPKIAEKLDGRRDPPPDPREQGRALVADRGDRRRAARCATRSA